MVKGNQLMKKVLNIIGLFAVGTCIIPLMFYLDARDRKLKNTNPIIESNKVKLEDKYSKKLNSYSDSYGNQFDVYLDNGYILTYNQKTGKRIDIRPYRNTPPQPQMNIPQPQELRDIPIYSYNKYRKSFGNSTTDKDLKYLIKRISQLNTLENRVYTASYKLGKSVNKSMGKVLSPSETSKLQLLSENVRIIQNIAEPELGEFYWKVCNIAIIDSVDSEN